MLYEKETHKKKKKIFSYSYFVTHNISLPISHFRKEEVFFNFFAYTLSYRCCCKSAKFIKNKLHSFIEDENLLNDCVCVKG